MTGLICIVSFVLYLVLFIFIYFSYFYINVCKNVDLEINEGTIKKSMKDDMTLTGATQIGQQYILSSRQAHITTNGAQKMCHSLKKILKLGYTLT